MTPHTTLSSGVGGAPVTGQEAETEVIALLNGFRREAAPSGAQTYAAEIIRCVREAVAAEIEAVPGAQCSMYEASDSTGRVDPHYPAADWSYCDGCTAAEAADYSQRAFASIARSGASRG